MRRTCIVLSLACTAVLSLPAAAQAVATLHPMSQKYRDAGAKPATGRSGTASLEIRALRGMDGKTDLEVTTGELEAGTTRGVLDKVQVKLLAPDGESMQTDNTRPGTGYCSVPASRCGTLSIVLTLGVTSSPVRPSPRVAPRTRRPFS